MSEVKSALERELNALLEPIRQEFKSAPMQDLIQKAYPKKAIGSAEGISTSILSLVSQLNGLYFPLTLVL